MLLNTRAFSDHELPRLVQLNDNLFAASFFLMKLLPARYMLDKAEHDGSLKPGGVICETTSGTFGLALAMLAAIRGYRLILVSDPAIDRNLHNRLIELGAELEIIEKPYEIGGFQKARLDRLNAVLKDNPGSYCPSQYSNPNNPQAYCRVAEQIAERIGHIDCLIGTVGSGGSMSGLAQYLRAPNPDLFVIGVDAPNSVVFGQPDGPRSLRGLGNSLVPVNVDHTQFDQVHWVTTAEAYVETRNLHQSHALFHGGTSGAAFKVAKWWSDQNPEAKCLVIFPDEGHRYNDTIYNDDYLDNLVASSNEIRSMPILCNSPEEPMDGWSYFNWNLRNLNDVISYGREAAE